MKVHGRALFDEEAVSLVGHENEHPHNVTMNQTVLQDLNTMNELDNQLHAWALERFCPSYTPKIAALSARQQNFEEIPRHTAGQMTVRFSDTGPMQVLGGTLAQDRREAHKHP